ncbi:hypothetical protein HJC23_000980 [Cyclotella cryptica]|uniref:Origin recognition complex subunit 4 n=1 Tax=Cyclotella cryptica TaxID=29204 RepID=A0ABD3QMY9_9STRA|eukprot:CCRYP_004100-RA/>CCRYP_004100-RA protein AED:0.00 eAED:0.00 QI:87/1/1/1/0/0/2/1662/857
MDSWWNSIFGTGKSHPPTPGKSCHDPDDAAPTMDDRDTTTTTMAADANDTHPVVPPSQPEEQSSSFAMNPNSANHGDAPCHHNEDDSTERQTLQRRRVTVHRFDTRLTAITRAMLHLSDGSYSLHCDNGNDYSGNTDHGRDDDTQINIDDPRDDCRNNAPTGWKEQYNELFGLLKRGLLGYDTDDDARPSETMAMKHTKESSDANNEEKSRKKKNAHSNVSAVLMGPRGQGKSFILERCLADLSLLAGKRTKQQQSQQQQPQSQYHDTEVAFRVVRLNGLLYGGENAVACTREIARQIGDMAKGGGGRRKRRDGRRIEETERKEKRIKQACDAPSALRDGGGDSAHVPSTKQTKGFGIMSNTIASIDSPATNCDDIDNEHRNEFGNRRSGFNTNLALLDEALRTARIDNIPILIILEELDAFIAKGRYINKHTRSVQDREDNAGISGSNDRQLLLYHLLDRVADHKYLVSLVGLTTNLSTVSKFEKRVLSRAEGTSKFIYFGRMSQYDDLVEGLLMAFHSPLDSLLAKSGDDEKEYPESEAMMELRKDVEYILRGGDRYHEEDNEVDDDYSIVRRVIERNYEVRDMDMRWFCRVLDVALGLLASDIESSKMSYMQSLSDDVERSHNAEDPANVKLTPSHFAIALNALGASICDTMRTRRPGIPSSDSLMLIRWGKLLGDPNHYSTVVGNEPRLRALLDLSGPQVAVLLAAQRILARDDSLYTTEDAVDSFRKQGAHGSSRTIAKFAAPLSYQRIHDEYTTSFVASGRYTTSSDRYPSHILRRAFIDLLELDLIRLKKDHSGGGPLQYEHCDVLSTGATITHLPLLVNLQMEEEFMGLLIAGVLHCSTALREWGMKTS